MTDVRIATTDGTGKVLESAAVQAFRDELRGPLIGPEDANYDETRRVWNGMIDRRPALIARWGGVADVIAAVRFARDHRLLVSVRGGGQISPGNAVGDGGHHRWRDLAHRHRWADPRRRARLARREIRPGL